MFRNCEVVLDITLIERLIPRLERLVEDEKQKEEKVKNERMICCALY